MKLSVPVLALLGCAVPALSFGQSFEMWVGSGASMLSNNNIGSTSLVGSPSDIQLKGGFRLDFRMGLNTGSRWGHEIGYAYNRTQFVETGYANQGMAIHQGFYDFLVYATKDDQRIRPYATGGVQFSNFVPPGSSAGSGGGQTKFGFNYGAGVKVRVTHSIGVRFDFRQYDSGKPFGLYQASGLLRQNVISASVGYLL
jgi:opacity protein-like surface antigen